VARPSPLLHAAGLLPFVAAAWLATMRPDPLAPIAHVELVFALAFAQAPWVGILVVLAAAEGLLLLGAGLRRVDRALLAVPAYYAVLFAASLPGLTPAPCIGLGAGPWLGFGLMAGLVAGLRRSAAEGPATGA
jgi:hypothetical protein